ncbi:hypothetical protein JWJ90_15765 [Desulfobulbus rhabdoformis]|jgi:hypothetical protein|uniref:hypothetical protein n=1 Tax=Desulfobulbus rhabdoformis TaxID=34032 RepID=UPI00196664BA|nr:hypothetical protein [Desulfobulbus rhabdoformis]MBM9615726.1 hypothetical protein [Desulfobulbus rhabdoformis]
MSESKNLTKQVEEINTELRGFGRAAVQEIKMMKDGKVVGQIRYGYKPQYVFDAVNKILLPENWRYEVVSKEIFDSQVVAEVRLFIRVNDSEWICKGSQTGQMQIVKGNVGDSYKGAITDAIQKCLSLLSIGTDAYRGLLRDVYLGSDRPTAPTPKQQQEQSSKASTNLQADLDKSDADLPKIAGISYQRKDGIVVAVGNSFDKKDLLKSAGFKWDKADKNWYKEVVLH